MPLAPSLFDLQINGYAGVDFNQDDLTAEQLQTVCDLLAKHESVGILATFVTETIPTLTHRLRKIVQLREQVPLAKKLIAGIHIEGPFLNDQPGYRGAHPSDAMQPATPDAMKLLLDAGGGLVKLVTIAPERDAEFATTRMLAKQDIAVSAGHTDASFDQLHGAIDAGLTLFTHLGNGCPMQMHRHDNIIQRALHHAAVGRLTPCFIADGVHVPFFVLSNYLKLIGPERCVIVTDAVAPAGLGPGRYRMSRWDLLIGEDMVARSPDGSHFVGAAITMPQTGTNLLEKLGMTAEQVRIMTSDNPRRAVRL